MSHEEDKAEEALLAALGQRARQLDPLAPEPLEALLAGTMPADEVPAFKERVTEEPQRAFLQDTLVPLSAERQAHLLDLAEAAFGPEEAATSASAGESQGATARLQATSGQLEQPQSEPPPKPHAAPLMGPRRWWQRRAVWLVAALVSAAAMTLYLARPAALAPPLYILEAQVGDAPMLSPGVASKRVSAGSLLQLVLRPPAVTQQRPAVFLFVAKAAAPNRYVHVPAKVVWGEDGSARIRLPVSEALPGYRGGAQLVVVAAPASTSQQDVAAALQLNHSRTEPWRRYPLSLDVVP